MEYKKSRNKICKAIRKAKKEYMKSIESTSPKDFWKMFKCLTKGCSSIPVLIAPDSSHVTDDIAKANLLNTTFSSNFNSVSSNCNLNLNFPQGDKLPTDLQCTKDEIYTLLTTLDVKKSSGADGISARMLKFTAASIFWSVTDLFNMSCISC